MASITTIHPGRHVEADLNGEDVLEEILELIRQRLPRLPTDDPVREALAEAVPELARNLGYMPATLVRKEDEV